MLLLGFAIFAIAWMNWRAYSLPGNTSEGYPGDVIPQLNNIGRRLRAGEGSDMQKLFPEGWFFSHILYGLAWINVGLQTHDEALRNRAAVEARWILAATETPEGRAPFQADTQVPNGVFYLGWKNRLLGGLLKLSRPEERFPSEVELFHRQSQSLSNAFLASRTLHLDAYPGEAWPCDNVMALASLVLHDDLYGTRYREIVAAWVEFTKKHLDPATGLIVHKIDGRTGDSELASRASTQVYIHSLLPELDPDFAREQYAKFRREFVVDWCGYLPVREYPIGVSGTGDVDSGPLLFGISPSATTVSIAAARVNGDRELFERNVILSETLGIPWQSGSEKSFAFGKIVVADAFLAWGKSAVSWSDVPPVLFAATTSPSWRMRLHAISSCVVIIFGGFIRKMWRSPAVA
jgi:hypothetical protein